VEAARTPDEALRAGRLLAATELAAHPYVISRLRHTFDAIAYVSTNPTENGKAEIDHFHPYFGIHVLRGKPLSSFKRFDPPMVEHSSHRDSKGLG
jgi:hypothetical protein